MEGFRRGSRFGAGFGAVLCVVAMLLASVGGAQAGTDGAQAAGCGSLSPLQIAPVCNLNHTTLTAKFSLAGSILWGVNLNLAQVSGQGALLGSNLTGANLSDATITAGDALINANLPWANLDHIQLKAPAIGEFADLEGANLTMASIAGLGDLAAANLSGANLSRATISGIGALSGAQLQAADLRGATVTGLDALKYAHYADTICPDGTNSDRDAGSCQGHLIPRDQGHGVFGMQSAADLLTTANVITAADPSPVALSQLQLASPDVTWQDGATTGSPSSSCDSYPAGSPDPSTMSLSADGNGDAQISFDAGSQGPPAAFIASPAAVEQTAPAQLQFVMSGSETLGANTATFTDTFTGYGTVYTGTLTETLGSCTWTTLVTLTFAGSGLTLTTTSPPAPLPAGASAVANLANGTLNLAAYCATTSYPAIATSGADAFAWACKNSNGQTVPISIQAACTSQHPDTLAFLANPADATSWSCISLKGASSNSTYTVQNGGYTGTVPDGSTLLAFGGGDGAGGLPDFADLGGGFSGSSLPDFAPGDLVTFGGGAGSSGLPDIVYDTSSNGGSITLSTPNGSLIIAESGSLATGGAV